MKIAFKLLYLASLMGMAGVAAIGVARIGHPSMTAALLLAVLIASLAGGPGLISRRAWPAALLLLPAGAYLVMRLQVPSPSAEGIGGEAAFYLGQLRSGAQAYVNHQCPLDVGGASDLRLVISLGVYGAAGVAAFVALSLRRALPAVAITLALLGFSLTVDTVGRVVWLPLAFLVLAGCTLMLSRSLVRRRWTVGDAVGGGATTLVAALLALLLLGVTSVSAGRPWADWRAWGPSGTGASHIWFDWMADYPRLLDPQTNAPVMQVRSGVASYWRANALDSFTGVAWVGDSTTSPAAEPERRGDEYSYAVPSDDPPPPGRPVTEVFDIRALYTDFFFAGGTPTRLVLGEPAHVYVSGAKALTLHQVLGPSLQYTVRAVVPQLKAADLVGRGRTYSMGMMRYLALPFPAAAASGEGDPAARWLAAAADDPAAREWLGLFRLNRRIVGDATDPYEKTLRIEEYLRSRYRYSLSPQRTRYESAFAAFLFETKTGHCQHFAGVMAVLLRFNGIPARVAVGFTTGKRVSAGTYLVSRNNAHAWTEVFFPGIGWVPFDPTPGNTLPGQGPSSANAGFVDPFSAGGAGTATPSAAPPARPRPNTASARPSVTQSAAATSSGTLGWLPWALAPVAVLLLWPTARAALRRGRQSRGSLDERLRTSVRLLFTDLRDYGAGAPPSWTLQETAGFLTKDLGLDASGFPRRVEAIMFGGRTATRQDLADLAALRRRVRRRLRERAGWIRALLVSYGLAPPAR